LAKPALRALAAGGYTRLEQFTRIQEADLLALHSMGPKAMGLIRAALRARGLSFADPDLPRGCGRWANLTRFSCAGHRRGAPAFSAEVSPPPMPEPPASLFRLQQAQLQGDWFSRQVVLGGHAGRDRDR
jgi:hypothetical protein